jgi:hypothetical protein
MIDLGAPIVPGKSAAGVLLGSVVNELLATVRPRTTTKVSIGEKHDLGAVNVWAKDGVIIQVGVYSGYRGLLQSGIRLGSTIRSRILSAVLSKKTEKTTSLCRTHRAGVLKPKNGKVLRL